MEAAPKAGVLAAPKAGVCSPKAGVLELKLEDEAAPKPPVIWHGVQQCRAWSMTMARPTTSGQAHACLEPLCGACCRS